MTKRFQSSGAKKKKTGFRSIQNGSAVVTQRSEENRAPCDFPTFHPNPSLHPQTPLPFFFVPESFICLIHSGLFKVTSLLLFPGTGLGTQIRDCLIRAERREPRERKMWVLDRTNRTPTKCLLSKDPKAQIPPFLPKQPWLCLFPSYHLFTCPLMFSAPLCDVSKDAEV